MTVTIEKTEQVYKGWTSLSKVTLNDGASSFHREVEDHGVAVAVLPYDPERRVALLVTLPRTPVMMAGEEELYEAPAAFSTRARTRKSARAARRMRKPA